MGFVKYQKDKITLAEFVKENETVFQKLSRETVQAISVLGNAKELMYDTYSDFHIDRFYKKILCHKAGDFFTDNIIF